MPLIALAERAAARGPNAERLTFLCGDVADPPSQIANKQFDHVMSNPPFMALDSGQLPRDKAKRVANFESTIDLVGWIAQSFGFLRPGGTWTMVHRTARVDEILGVLEAYDVAVKVLDLVPMDDGRPPKRSVVFARHGASAPTERMSLTVHRADGHYTAEADAILRDAAPSPIVSR
jgi:tRNA1(Val) A37 N6-methylase TrmN6